MPIQCEVCDKYFSSVSNLNKHRKNIHHLDSASNLAYERNTWSHTCLEKNCSVSFRRNGQLINHLRNAHKFSIRTEEMEFPDMSTFEAWKEEMEMIENCSYILARGKRVNKKGDEITTFVCNRSGKERIRDTHKLQHLSKIRGSCKIGTSCISEMTITTKKKKIFVTRVISHYGHEIESKLLCIINMDKNKNGSKPVGANKFRMLDDMRTQMGRNSTQNHIDILIQDNIVKESVSGGINVKSSTCMNSDYVATRYRSHLNYEDGIDDSEDSMQEEDNTLDEDSSLDEDSITDENSSFEDVIVLAPIRINGEHEIQDKDKLKEKIQNKIAAVQASVLSSDFNNMNNTILQKIHLQLSNVEHLLNIKSIQTSSQEISLNINSYQKIEKDKTVFTTKRKPLINNKFLEVGLPSTSECKKLKMLLGNTDFDCLVTDHDYE